MLVTSYTCDQEDDFDWAWEDFKDEVRIHLKGRKYPVKLVAINSNWRGETGYAVASSPSEIVAKLCSFDSSFYKFHRDGNLFYFTLATHDSPTGIRVEIRSIK